MNVDERPLAISLTSEELACLLFLVGAAGHTSAVGVTGYPDIDAEGFDVGMRGLIVRQLVEVGDEQVGITNIAIDVAQLLCAPDYAATMYLIEAEGWDGALLLASDDLTAVVHSPVEGAFEVGVYPMPMVDSIMRIAIDRTPDGDDGWSLGMRVQPVNADPVDLAFAGGRRGLVADGLPIDATDDEIRRAIASALVPLPT